MAKIVDKYRLETVIGKGQFGKVYKGFNMQTSEEFAIKSIKREIYEETPKLKQFVVNEIQTLSRINNSHVVKFIEMITTVNHIYFIYEFCNGGTLEDAIFSRGYYQEEEALIIFKEIVNGLKPVVQMNIIHRDLKPQNILFHEGLVKIADFGFCKPLSSRKDLAKTILGSPIYMAPEILLGEEYTMKADIWSMGVIYYEMLFGICPFEGKNIAQLIDLINEYELKFPEQYKVSEKTKILVKRMLCRDSTKRIEWEEILEILNLQTPSSMKVIIPQKFLKPSFIYTEMNRIPSTQNTSTQSASLPRIFKSKLETKLPKAEITSPTNISNKLPIEEPLYSAANRNLYFLKKLYYNIYKI